MSHPAQIPDDQWKQLLLVASDEDRTVASLIRRYVREGLFNDMRTTNSVYPE